MNPEERKATAMRAGLHGEPMEFIVCDRYYPKCCNYHQGFDDALALLVSIGGDTWCGQQLYAVEPQMRGAA